MQETALTVAPANIINAYKYNFTPRMEHLRQLFSPICQPLPASEVVKRERGDASPLTASFSTSNVTHSCVSAVIDICTWCMYIRIGDL